ncbi:MAG TPA: hypothetical protein VK821_00965 [Dehalococcoidia bacterium]|nr:hypothetical protein [Dehalococcoidia bacterium]
MVQMEERGDVAHADAARPPEMTLRVSLPPVLGIVADLGLVLSLVLVLVGGGAIGTAASILLGAASLAAVITSVVHGQPRRLPAPALRPAAPSYALVRDDSWYRSGRVA